MGTEKDLTSFFDLSCKLLLKSDSSLEELQLLNLIIKDILEDNFVIGANKWLSIIESVVAMDSIDKDYYLIIDDILYAILNHYGATNTLEIINSLSSDAKERIFFYKYDNYALREVIEKLLNLLIEEEQYNLFEDTVQYISKYMSNWDLFQLEDYNDIFTEGYAKIDSNLESSKAL